MHGHYRWEMVGSWPSEETCGFIYLFILHHGLSSSFLLSSQYLPPISCLPQPAIHSSFIPIQKSQVFKVCGDKKLEVMTIEAKTFFFFIFHS